MTDPAAPRDVVDFQLAVLDAYEKLLASCSWDELRLNEALKSMMSSMLPLLRAQRVLGEQLFDRIRSLSGNTGERSKPRCISPMARPAVQASGRQFPAKKWHRAHLIGCSNEWRGFPIARPFAAAMNRSDTLVSARALPSGLSILDELGVRPGAVVAISGTLCCRAAALFLALTFDGYVAVPPPAGAGNSVGISTSRPPRR